jgi:hexosaminidase
MRRTILSAVITLCVSIACAAPDKGETGIVPAVKDWRSKDGSFTFADRMVINVSEKEREALFSVAEKFKADLLPQGFPLIEISVSDTHASNCILLALDKSADEHGKEAYSISISPDKILVHAADPIGVFYGTRSLLHMIRVHNGKIPCGEIRDWPDYPGRMLMLDVSRKPWPLSVLRDYVRILAWYKMNELHLHLSDKAADPVYSAVRVESEVFPGLSARDLCYSKTEIREFVAFAKGYGITVTPEFDMPGHATPFVKYFPDCAVKNNPDHLDVRNPKTLEVMKKFVDEMIPLFEAPDFHIGTDEYRIPLKDAAEKEEVHAAFRRFINEMNAHIRSRGKNCRIWSGFEGMEGKSVKIDPSVIVDMWDPYHPEHDGHKVISSYQCHTYVCPGCHYYGISPAFLYEGWDPGTGPSVKPAVTPPKGDPRMLGGKLHVWGDLSPTGFTLTEIAWETMPGIQSMSEKLWGNKASQNYDVFKRRADAVLPVSGTTIMNRFQFDSNPIRADVVLQVPQEIELATAADHIELPWAQAERADLEYPWTLTMEIMPTKDSPGRGVLISSDLVEIGANIKAPSFNISLNFADNTKTNTQLSYPGGIGLARASGARHGLGSPAETHLAGDSMCHFRPDFSAVKDHAIDPVMKVHVGTCYPGVLTVNTAKSSRALPRLNQWTSVTILGERGRTTLIVDGVKVGEVNNQMVCPLRYFGSIYGESFIGKIRNVKVYNRILSAEEIAKP